MQNLFKELEYKLFNIEEIVTPFSLEQSYSISTFEAREKLQEFYNQHFEQVGAMFCIAHLASNGSQTIVLTNIDDSNLQGFITQLQSQSLQIFDLSLQCIFPLHRFTGIKDMERQVYNLNSLVQSKRDIERPPEILPPITTNLTNIMNAMSIDTMKATAAQSKESKVSKMIIEPKPKKVESKTTKQNNRTLQSLSKLNLMNFQWKLSKSKLRKKGKTLKMVRNAIISQIQGPQLINLSIVNTFKRLVKPLEKQQTNQGIVLAKPSQNASGASSKFQGNFKKKESKDSKPAESITNFFKKVK